MPEILHTCSFPSCDKFQKADAPPFVVCGRCRARHYCSAECQRQDWRSHEKDCENLATFLANKYAHYSLRSRMHRAIEDLATSRDSESVKLAKNRDTTFWLLRKRFQVDDLCSYAGPFFPLEEIQYSLQVELKKANNVIDAGDWYKTILAHHGGIEYISELRVPLIDGQVMTYRIITEHNPEVAALWRNNSGQPKPTWMVMERKLCTPGDQDYLEIIGSYMSVEEANRVAETVEQRWRTEYLEPEFGYTWQRDHDGAKFCFLHKRQGIISAISKAHDIFETLVDGEVLKVVEVVYHDGAMLDSDGNRVYL